MIKQMGHEISNLQLKYQVYLNDKITQTDKDKIMKYLDNPPSSIETSNEFIRLLITNNVSYNIKISVKTIQSILL